MSRFTLVRVGERLYLKDGRRRLLLDGPSERGDFLLFSAEMLNRLLEAWLADDALWGGHAAANQMRYMHRSAGGVQGFLDEAYKAGAGWLGVLNWRLMGPSVKPIGARHLVRIVGADVKAIRVLDARGQNGPAVPSPRLFPHEGALLLWEPTGVVELGPDGERRRTLLRLTDPTDPYLLLSDRWLIGLRQESGTRIDAIDLRRRRVVPLLEEAGLTAIVGYDPLAPTLLLRSCTDDARRDRLSLISVPGGRRRWLPDAWLQKAVHLWRGQIVVTDDRTLVVYDAATLKPLQRLTIPAGR